MLARSVGFSMSPQNQPHYLSSFGSNHLVNLRIEKSKILNKTATEDQK
jgi:hypothetical protein